ncbi:MAG: non-ribosomal peptide synthetase [Rubrivivax sp.]|nr:non-ribosomal peptide synthetase [Rubrivivax sp.]
MEPRKAAWQRTWLAAHEVPADFEPFDAAETEQSLAGRFEACVRRHAHRWAVVEPQARWTYAQLNEKANGLAAVLLGDGGRPPASVPYALARAPVAVLAGHGALQIAAILGVLKAGRPYVGLDARHDLLVNAQVLAHCGASHVLCDAAGLPLARRMAELARSAPPVVPVDIDAAAAAPRAENPVLARGADDLAYIYYTSGTTGAPKGVVDSQRNVLHNVMRYTNNLGIAPSDRLSLLQSVAFSGQVSSLFAALLNGAACLPLDVRTLGASGVADGLERAGATMLHCVPSIFERLVATGRRFEALRVIRLEGDQASVHHAELFKRHFDGRPGVVLANGLGATETGLSHQFIFRHDTPLPVGALPVGAPCADIEGLLLDEEGRPIAGREEAGEVAIRSRYLALGYWQRPELTAERFVVGAEPRGERIYRTGDIGRYDLDGCLHLLGRSGSTHKLHGHWVDLQAVEAALLRMPGVQAAAAVLRDGPRAGIELVAYLVATPPPPGELGAPLRPQAARPALATLREALRVARGAVYGADGAALPQPSRFVWIDALPLDANGKVARHALPAPPRTRPDLGTPCAPPCPGVEETLARLWAEVLGLEEVGAEDDFAELGGSSLQAIDIVTRAEQRFALAGRAPRLIEAATVRAMAQLVSALQAGAGENRS